MLRRLVAVVVAALACVPAMARAEDRALVIGVGRFADSKINPLPGIDLDTHMALEIVEKLGFKPAQVKTLSNQEATYDAIRRAVEEWLIAGAGPNDRVLFYFSGHGSQIPDLNGDEEDGLDEVLITYDTRIAGDTLANVVVDDEMGEWLARMRAGISYVFVDACHSGSITKGLRAPASAVVKYFSYRAASKSAPTVAAKDESFADQRSTRSVGAGRYVALTAAADNEQSLASSKGSFFTLGLKKAVDGALAAHKLTLREMQSVAADEIARLADASRVHHPQIGGDLTLADANLFGVTRADAVGDASLWRQFETLVDNAADHIDIANVRDEYSLRDRMQMSVSVARPGYLNVLSISEATGTATVLFPNKMATENQVSGPTVVLPGQGARYQLIFAKPQGVSEERNLLVAFLTDRPLNAYNLGSGADLFRELSGEASKSAKGAIAAEVSYAAGKVVYVLK